MKAERIPTEVFCLAEFLSDEMQARGWKTEDLAFLMSKTEDEFARNLLAVDLLMCVQKDSLLVGESMFDKLSTAFDVDSAFFKNLDEQWRKAPPERRSQFTPPESIFGPISRRSAFHVVE